MRNRDILNLVGLRGPREDCVFDMTAETIYVARGSEQGETRGNGIVLNIDDAGVSNEHGRIIWNRTEKAWYVIDDQSMNGTCVNLERVPVFPGES